LGGVDIYPSPPDFVEIMCNIPGGRMTNEAYRDPNDECTYRYCIEIEPFSITQPMYVEVYNEYIVLIDYMEIDPMGGRYCLDLTFGPQDGSIIYFDIVHSDFSHYQVTSSS